MCSTINAHASTLVGGWLRLAFDNERTTGNRWYHNALDVGDKRRKMFSIALSSHTTPPAPHRTVDVTTSFPNHTSAPFPQCHTLLTPRGRGDTQDGRGLQSTAGAWCAVYVSRPSPEHASRFTLATTVYTCFLASSFPASSVTVCVTMYEDIPMD